MRTAAGLHGSGQGEASNKATTVMTNDGGGGRQLLGFTVWQALRETLWYQWHVGVAGWVAAPKGVHVQTLGLCEDVQFYDKGALRLLINWLWHRRSSWSSGGADVITKVLESIRGEETGRCRQLTPLWKTAAQVLEAGRLHRVSLMVHSVNICVVIYTEYSFCDRNCSRPFLHTFILLKPRDNSLR